MKRLILAAAILAVSIPSCNPARAADHDRIGLGFRSNVIGSRMDRSGRALRSVSVTTDFTTFGQNFPRLGFHV